MSERVGTDTDSAMTTNKQHFWIDREYERITTEISCQAGPLGGNRKTAVIINLSAGGLKFACNREVFNLLLPEDQRIPGQVIDVDIEIDFRLEYLGRENPLPVRTRARIVHTERLAQDRYTLGVQFIALGDAESRGIESYLQSLATGAGRL
jgi:hypothetical protein